MNITCDFKKETKKNSKHAKQNKCSHYSSYEKSTLAHMLSSRNLNEL